MNHSRVAWIMRCYQPKGLMYLFTFTLMIFLSLSTKAGVSVKKYWDKEAIKVCFADKKTNVVIEGTPNILANWKEEQKRNIQKMIENEYRAERTGYQFVGFKDCKDTINPDVLILRLPTLSPVGLARNGMATTGPTSVQASTTYKSARGIVIFSSTGLKRPSTVVHEFGHILGLMHEHSHPDAMAEARSGCHHYTKTTRQENRYFYTPFDETSVMNYCTIGSDGYRGLSSGDVIHLQEIYKRSL